MPAPFISTFASAAASSGDPSGNKRDGAGGGGGDWSRSRPNGATQTFRRSSHATTPSQTRDTAQTTSGSNNTGAYIPPHLNSNHPSRNGATGDTRYSKDQMLAIFQNQKDSGGLDRNLDDLFLGSWDPATANNGTSTQSARGDAKDQFPGPEVCWNHSVESEPFGMLGMDDEERQFFTSSVNSPIKLAQTNIKENTGSGITSARKPSLSGYGSVAGNAARPGARRRDTSDSFTANGPLSPTESKTFFRNEASAATPPAALLRRRTDFKDDEPGADQREDGVGEDDGADAQTPFSSLRRTGTGPLSAGLNAPSPSPWSAAPPPSTFGSMGTFGSFAIGSTNQEFAEKRPGFGSARGGSRFKDLLAKTSTEDMISSGKEKGQFGALEKLPEEDADATQSRLRDMFKTRPNRSETNPYDDGPPRSGSAALSGSQDGGALTQGVEHLGFTAFGAPPNVGARDFGHGEGAFHQTPQGRFNPHDPMSPTNTNPYQSPQGNQNDDDDQDTNDSASQPSGLPPFGSNRRAVFSGSDDRAGAPPSATQRSAGAFGVMSGFGGLPGAPSWSSAGLGSGTPARERGIGASAFGDPIFSPFGDMQPPNAAIGPGFFGSAGFGNAGRPSRLGAMFPPAMQDEMQGAPFESRPESAQQSAGIRDPFDGGRRREEAFGGFDEALNRGMDEAPTTFGQQGPIGPISSGPQTSSIAAPTSSQRASTGPEHGLSGHGLSQSSGSSSSNQMPAAQQRQMVMPDRMRWIYRDPQGNTQGPWSGLEMHDWFKAGFFTAELQVKKLEDVEYEPLAQLVRRIGNSREPFLVPQIGVPHGPATAAQGNHWASPTLGPAGSQGSNGQPPFASAFPSFGTTLTAEQQNALERRKQEEQFLMARQKEHLAQQQVYMKQIGMHNGPHGMHSLQHHSSAQSLHSQPSFGSIASPGGAYQPSPMQGPIQPPPNMGSAPTSNANQPPFGREDDLPNILDRMSFSQRANFQPGNGPLGTSGDANGPNSQQMAAMHQDRARLQQQQHQNDMRAHQDAFLGQQGRNDRLEEFNELRGQAEVQLGRPGPEQNLPRPIGPPANSDASSAGPIGNKQPAPIGRPGAIQKPMPVPTESEELSLSQQVQRTAAANQQAASDSVWSKMESQPIVPPPVSISPLPAPAAQRNRQHVADALAAESRSATQTPIETPGTSLAPWAERTAEAAKGPSLKEIQEAEAKRAAEQEVAAAVARRAQAEQERLVQAQTLPPPPGLPSTSTWGASTSPATPTTLSTSVWAKQPVGKPAVAANGSTKKTLAQIQKEEESRKQRAVAAANAAASAQAANSPIPTIAGKRYAELASKIAPTPPSAGMGAWTTVGFSGKAKTPAAVIATPQAAVRSISASSANSMKPKPALQSTRSTTVGNQSKANEEFAKWTKGSLGKGLNSSINLDNFVQDLLMLPPEVEIISDSIYASSPTLDGRRFAEEFVRRRKLADKGIVEPATTTAQMNIAADTKNGAGGWSEVAKKGPAAKEDASAAAFKVVATKKKGKR